MRDPAEDIYTVLLAVKKDLVIPQDFFENVNLEMTKKSTIAINFYLFENHKKFEMELDKNVKIAEIKLMIKQKLSYYVQPLGEIQIFSGQKGRQLEDDSSLRDIVEEDTFFVFLGKYNYKLYMKRFWKKSHLISYYDEKYRISNLSDKEKKLFYLLYREYHHKFFFGRDEFLAKDFVKIVKRFETSRIEVESTIEFHELNVDDLRNDYQFFISDGSYIFDYTAFYCLFYQNIGETKRRIGLKDFSLIVILISLSL